MMAVYTCGKGCNPIESPYQCQDSVKTYEGAVLQTWENNGYSDSDFIAAVWDEDSQTVKTVMYATTRGWTYHNGAKVDATPEVLAKAGEWLAVQAFTRALWKSYDDHGDPTVGKTVRSLTTRGKNKGVVGTIVARRVNPYGTYYANGYNRPESIYNQQVKVQVHGENRMAWLSADKVEVIDSWEPDIDALRGNAKAYGEQGNFMARFSRYWV
jgi:hypothetical protein